MLLRLLIRVRLPVHVVSSEVVQLLHKVLVHMCDLSTTPKGPYGRPVHRIHMIHVLALWTGVYQHGPSEKEAL